MNHKLDVFNNIGDAYLDLEGVNSTWNMIVKAHEAIWCLHLRFVPWDLF